jgi:hypothetical protein
MRTLAKGFAKNNPALPTNPAALHELLDLLRAAGRFGR